MLVTFSLFSEEKSDLNYLNFDGSTPNIKIDKIDATIDSKHDEFLSFIKKDHPELERTFRENPNLIEIYASDYELQKEREIQNIKNKKENLYTLLINIVIFIISLIIAFKISSRVKNNGWKRILLIFSALSSIIIYIITYTVFSDYDFLISLFFASITLPLSIAFIFGALALFKWVQDGFNEQSTKP
jgi:membrane-associated HD superfamily phosphohydrolase